MELAQQALREAPFSRREIAEAAGVSYNTVREWAIGRRAPSRAALGKLAAALRRKQKELDRLAEQLEREAER